MIKAFGRVGDLRMAFELMDESRDAGGRLDVYAFNHLLSACLSDKDAGLKHAIEVRFIKVGLQTKQLPNVKSRRRTVENS